MSKINKLSKEVPPTEKDFQVVVEGDTTKKRFVGEFRCRIPRRKEQCMIDKHRAFLNGPMPEQLSPETLKFHHRISYLRYTIVDQPKWWKEADLGYELYDSNVVDEVYNQVLAFEEEWLTAVWGEEHVQGLKKAASGEVSDGKEAKATA